MAKNLYSGLAIKPLQKKRQKRYIKRYKKNMQPHSKKCKKCICIFSPHTAEKEYFPIKQKTCLLPSTEKKTFSNPTCQVLVDFFRKIHSLHNRAANRLLRKKKKNTTTEAPPTWIFFFFGGGEGETEQRRITIKMELTKQTKG